MSVRYAVDDPLNAAQYVSHEQGILVVLYPMSKGRVPLPSSIKFLIPGNGKAIAEHIAGKHIFLWISHRIQIRRE